MSSQARVAGLGGFLGLDFGSLEIVLRARQVPECDWIFVLDKLTLLTTIASRYWNKEKPNDKKPSRKR